MLRLFITSLLGTLVLVLCGAAARPATIEIRDEARAAGAVIRLGDVATISGVTDAAAREIAAIELGVAPRDGETKTLRVREIQDLLAQSGVDTTGYHFQGASAVRVGRGAGSLGARSTKRRVSSREVEMANQAVAKAIVAHLKSNAANEDWSAEVKLDESAVPAILEARQALYIAGGKAPWVGSQRFTIAAGEGAVLRPLIVSANVKLPAATVVAVRSLARGDIARAEDFTLSRDARRVGLQTESSYTSIEQVVGLEVIRPITAGQAVTNAMLRKPRLVDRGFVVTVVANSGGIKVKTTARARQAGSDGDLIEVEAIADKARYFARVSGVQQVEVLAGATAIASR
jgi:flagella basal body P-ring formation protein FlgA